MAVEWISPWTGPTLDPTFDDITAQTLALASTADIDGILTSAGIVIDDDDPDGILFGGAAGDIRAYMSAANTLLFKHLTGAPTFQFSNSTGSGVTTISPGSYVSHYSSSLAQFYNSHSAAGSYTRVGANGANMAENAVAVYVGSINPSQANKIIAMAAFVDGSTIVGGFGDGTVAPPTAAAANRAIFWIEQGAGGTRDKVWCCLKSDSDTYSWVSLGDGGA